MAYNYTTFQQALATEMAVPGNNVADPQFVQILPTLIDYAEQRCYRDLDLLFATNRNTLAATAGSRTLSLINLAPYLLILEDLNAITPSSITIPDQGTRNQIVPKSKEWLDAVYGGPTPSGVPRFFAMVDDVTVLLGPWPDQGYTIEAIGKFRPVPLYSIASQGGTFLSVYLPELFLAAAMVAASGYQRNFGAQMDDPRSAMSWEQQYQTLLPSAKAEENRKKFHGWQQLSSESAPPTTAPS